MPHQLVCVKDTVFEMDGFILLFEFDDNTKLDLKLLKSRIENITEYLYLTRKLDIDKYILGNANNIRFNPKYPDNLIEYLRMHFNYKCHFIEAFTVDISDLNTDPDDIDDADVNADFEHLLK